MGSSKNFGELLGVGREKRKVGREREHGV